MSDDSESIEDFISLVNNDMAWESSGELVSPPDDSDSNLYEPIPIPPQAVPQCFALSRPLADTVRAASLTEPELLIKRNNQGPTWLLCSNKAVQLALEILVPREGFVVGKSSPLVKSVCLLYTKILYLVGVRKQGELPGGVDDETALYETIYRRVRKGVKAMEYRPLEHTPERPTNTMDNNKKGVQYLLIAIGRQMAPPNHGELKLILERAEQSSGLQTFLENVVFIALRDSGRDSPPTASRQPTREPPANLARAPPAPDRLQAAMHIVAQLNQLEGAVQCGVKYSENANILKDLLTRFETEHCSGDQSTTTLQYPSLQIKDMIIYLIAELRKSVLQHHNRVRSLSVCLFPLLMAYDTFCKRCGRRPALPSLPWCQDCFPYVCRYESIRGGDGGNGGSPGGGSGGSGDGFGDGNTHNNGMSGFGGNGGHGSAGGQGTGNNFSYNQASGMQIDGARYLPFHIPLADGTSSFSVVHNEVDGYVVIHNANVTEDPVIQDTEDTASARNPNTPTRNPRNNDGRLAGIDAKVEASTDRLQANLNIRSTGAPVDGMDNPDPRVSDNTLRSLGGDAIRALESKGRMKSLAGGKTSPGGSAELRKLKPIMEKLKTDSDMDAIATFIVSTMQQNRDVIDVQHLCLSEIWNLCKEHEQLRKNLTTATVMSEMLCAMRTFVASTAIQETACGAIWVLSASPESCAAIARAGLIEYVLTSMHEYKYERSIIEVAIGALRSLSPDPTARKAMRELGAIPKICSSMLAHIHAQMIQEDGCYLISNLAIGEGGSICEAWGAELQTAVQVLETHRDTPAVACAACLVLKNYTGRKENLELLSTIDNVLDLLRPAAEGHDVKCKEHSLRVIGRLEKLYAEQKEESANKQIIGLVEQNTDPATIWVDIFGIMKDNAESQSVFLCGVQSMIRLVTKSGLNRGAMTAQHVAELITGLNTFGTSVEIQKGCCHLLNLMAQHDADSRQLIIGAGGCRALIKVFRRNRNDVEVKINVSKLLKELSVEYGCWFDIEANSHNGANKIIDEMMNTNPTHPEIEESVFAIISNFTKHMHI